MNLLEQHTALYSDLDIEYSQAMSGPYEDLCYRGDDAVVIAGLKDGRVSGFWRPMVAFGDDKALKMQIEALWSVSQDIYYQDFIIDGKLSVISQFLLRHGYKARPYYTQIIDLTKTEEELHAGLRKSYKSLVRKTALENEGFWGSHGWGKCMSDIHSRCTNPRPQKTWEIQGEMIRQGKAIPLISPDSYILTYVGGNCAYYASGRSMGSNMHGMIWKMMSFLRSIPIDIKSFEMGEQVFSGDQKLVNISKFKRGFGGKTVTRLNLTKE